MYSVHPSAELNRLFGAKPYQGAPLEAASFLFVGLDANYSPDIDRHVIFPEIMAYHSDGVSFWRRHGVHHPFLLPGYTGDGQFYHRSFAKIGFESRHADQVSFIELLHLPTCGRNKLMPADLDRSHLSRLDDVIVNGSAKHIFIPPTVARLMRLTHAFPWLPDEPEPTPGALGVLFRQRAKTIYTHLHFSVYGKFSKRKKEETAMIRGIVRSTEAQYDESRG
jgi:hypothetical protein